MVKSMHMFIQLAPGAIFHRTFMKTLFTSTATANWTLVALIYSSKKYSILRICHLSFLMTFLVKDNPHYFSDWLNGVLHCFQHYFNHIIPTAHIIHVFLSFTRTRLGLRTVLPKDTPMKAPEDPVQLESGDSRLQGTQFIVSHGGLSSLF